MFRKHEMLGESAQAPPPSPFEGRGLGQGPLFSGKAIPRYQHPLKLLTSRSTTLSIFGRSTCPYSMRNAA